MTFAHFLRTFAVEHAIAWRISYFRNMKTKEAFHLLIDQIKDEERLQLYYDLVKRLCNAPDGQLWNSLTDDQRADLLLSYEESSKPENTISHEEVRKMHESWLTR